MEVLLFLGACFVSFYLGVTFSAPVKRLFNRKKLHPVLADQESKHKLEVVITKIPQNQYTEYTIEELERRKRTLEKEYKQCVNWPALRQKYAREIKEILDILEWHYDQNGTREFLAQKEKTRRELAEFDEKYRAALRGVN